MTPRPIDPGIDAGRAGDPDDTPGVDPDRFRETFARWASGVAIVALRDPDDGRVHAVTASSVASISARPPRLVISMGPGAQPLPFLEPDGPFVVSLLGESQKGLAQRFADSYPVGPSPFPAEGPPVVRGAHAVLHCVVERIVPVGDCRLIVALVTDTQLDDSEGPLLHYRRSYRTFG